MSNFMGFYGVYRVPVDLNPRSPLFANFRGIFKVINPLHALIVVFSCFNMRI